MAELVVPVNTTGITVLVCDYVNVLYMYDIHSRTMVNETVFVKLYVNKRSSCNFPVKTKFAGISCGLSCEFKTRRKHTCE